MQKTDLQIRMNCIICNKENKNEKGWWYLSNYYQITGWVCPNCYKDIAHIAFGKPKHPIKYLQILKIFQKRKLKYI
jgi:hypothetical protein